MARGRFVSRSLFNSEKFAAACSSCDGGPWAGMLYLALLTNANVDGRVDVGSEALLDALGRTARHCELGVRYWMQKLLVLERVELVKTWESGGRLYAEIWDFFVHNSTRADREGDGKIPV